MIGSELGPAGRASGGHVASESTDLDVALLGPVQVRVGGAVVALTGMERLFVAILALEPGRAVPLAVIVDRLWGDAPPASARNAVQVFASRLRRVLGRQAVRTTSGGYALLVAADRVDVLRFEHLTG